MTLLLLLACKTVTSTAEPLPDVAVEQQVQEPEEIAPAVKPTPKPMPLLSINPSDLRVDEANGKLIYAPGAMVQSSTYTEYWMDLDKALETLGGMPETEVRVRFQVVESKVRVVTPEQDMPSPEGGIQVTELHGFLVAPSPGLTPPTTPPTP